MRIVVYAKPPLFLLAHYGMHSGHAHSPFQAAAFGIVNKIQG